MDQLRGGSCDHPGLYQVPLHLHLCLSNLMTATSVPLPLSEKSALLTREIYIWGPCSTGNIEGIHKQCVSGALVPCRIFVVSSVSHVLLFATRWTVACQASRCFSISWRLFKLMSIELRCHTLISPSFVPSSSCPQFFLTSGSFPMSQLFH